MVVSSIQLRPNDFNESSALYCLVNLISQVLTGQLSQLSVQLMDLLIYCFLFQFSDLHVQAAFWQSRVHQVQMTGQRLLQVHQ